MQTACKRAADRNPRLEDPTKTPLATALLIWQLPSYTCPTRQAFSDGKDALLTGNCAGLVPIKNKIVQLMTVPLIQGSLRYSWYCRTGASCSAKQVGELAAFATAVVPQVHACSASAAALIATAANPNSFTCESATVCRSTVTDFGAIKAAFESCYTNLGATCKMVGGKPRALKRPTRARSQTAPASQPRARPSRLTFAHASPTHRPVRQRQPGLERPAHRAVLGRVDHGGYQRRAGHARHRRHRRRSGRRCGERESRCLLEPPTSEPSPATRPTPATCCEPTEPA